MIILNNILNDAIQYAIDNHLENDIADTTLDISIDIKSNDYFSISALVCVSVYINNKYIKQ